MRRSRWLVPLAVLLWCPAPLAAAAAAPTYQDDGWGRAEECVNWSEDVIGGFQPVDDLGEIFPEYLYPAILDKLSQSIPAWKKCCMPSFDLLQACYQVLFPGPNVHAILKLRCKMTCGVTGRLRTLVLAPVIVDAQASVPFDLVLYGPVQFTEFKFIPRSRPAKVRPG